MVAESVFPLLSLTQPCDVIFSKTCHNYPFVGSPNWVMPSAPVNNVLVVGELKGRAILDCVFPLRQVMPCIQLFLTIVCIVVCRGDVFRCL